MSVFLLVLKIIGITLLSIIALLLLIVMLVLFVPVRYRLCGSYPDEPYALAKVTWLLHLISLRFRFDKEGLTHQFRILGIPIRKREKKQKKNKQKKKEKPLNRPPKEDEYSLEGFEEEKKQITETADTRDSEPETDSVDEKKGFFAKLTEYLQKVYDLIVHFREKVRSFWQKLVSAKDNAVYYLDLLTDEHNKKTLQDALEQIFHILKAIRPRKWNIKARFGFDDPQTTGKVLVGLSIVYPWLGPHMDITPEYEENVIEGSAFFKGRIFVIVLLIAGWKLYFNKDLRKVIKDLKKEA